MTGAGVITGSATLTYAGNQVNAGSYTVTAHYAGDANHASSDGAAVAIAIYDIFFTDPLTGPSSPNLSPVLPTTKYGHTASGLRQPRANLT